MWICMGKWKFAQIQGVVLESIQVLIGGLSIQVLYMSPSWDFQVECLLAIKYITTQDKHCLVSP